MFSRYAALRRQLLVDPHVSKDGSNSPDLVMDNPLSQNPGGLLYAFSSGSSTGPNLPFKFY